MAARAYESPVDAIPDALRPRPCPTRRHPSDGDYGQLLAEFRSGQALLREAEVRFKLLVETIPGVAYIAEPGEHGEWIYISPRLHELVGYAPEEWIAEPAFWIDLIHPDDRIKVIEDEAGWTRDHRRRARRRVPAAGARRQLSVDPGRGDGPAGGQRRQGPLVRRPVRHHRVT